MSALVVLAMGIAGVACDQPPAASEQKGNAFTLIRDVVKLKSQVSRLPAQLNEFATSKEVETLKPYLKAAASKSIDGLRAIDRELSAAEAKDAARKKAAATGAQAVGDGWTGDGAAESASADHNTSAPSGDTPNAGSTTPAGAPATK